MFVPDIRQPSLKIRGAEASAEPISVITDAVLDVRQNHGLARGGVDALQMKIRGEGVVRRRNGITQKSPKPEGFSNPPDRSGKSVILAREYLRKLHGELLMFHIDTFGFNVNWSLRV